MAIKNCLVCLYAIMLLMASSGCQKSPDDTLSDENDFFPSQSPTEYVTLPPTDTSIPSPQPTLTSTPSPSHTTTATLLPTSTGIGTPLTEPTATFPGHTGNSIPLAELFFQGFSEDCQLPCWYGLVPGQTMPNYAFETLESVFGQGFLVASTDDTLIIGRQWIPKSLDERSVHIGSYFSLPSGKLSIISVNWTFDISTSNIIDMSPQIILRRFGSPTELQVETEQFIGGDFAEITLLFDYENGLVYRYLREVGLNTSRQFTLCLNSPPLPYNEAALDTLIIMRPEIGIEELDEARKSSFFGENFDLSNTSPFEDIFNISKEELARIVQSDDTVCLEGTLPLRSD